MKCRRAVMEPLFVHFLLLKWNYVKVAVQRVKREGCPKVLSFVIRPDIAPFTCKCEWTCLLQKLLKTSSEKLKEIEGNLVDFLAAISRKKGVLANDKLLWKSCPTRAVARRQPVAWISRADWADPVKTAQKRKWVSGWNPPARAFTKSTALTKAPITENSGAFTFIFDTSERRLSESRAVIIGCIPRS